MERSTLTGWLRLALAPNIGPVSAHRLLEHFGSIPAVFDCVSADRPSRSNIREKGMEALYSKETLDRANEEIDRAEKLGIKLIPPDSTDYPLLLRAIPNAPLVLYLQGELRPEDHISLAVVGPRKPSDYARRMAADLIPPLCARGVTIISGLAQGIDAEAHLAALDCGGRTIAVVGQGLDTSLYPLSNRQLARRISAEGRGAILSAFPFGTKPDAANFPKRNAVIAGLALGTLVIEAGEKSGALITAGHAAELNRPVMACPGDALRPNARGSNHLIAEGAALIQKSDDVLHALEAELRAARESLGLDSLSESGADQNLAAGANQTPLHAREFFKPSDPLESALAEILAQDHRTIDFILDHCLSSGFTQAQVVQKLLMLEMDGKIEQLPGRVYTLR